MDNTQLTNPMERELGGQVQHAFITYEADRTTLRTLANEVEQQLAALGSPATILLYGISPKRQDEFLIVEGTRGIPPAFIRQLKDDPHILDYAVCDVPSVKQEQQAITEMQRYQLQPSKVDRDGEAPELPRVPAGYQLTSPPIPLLSAHDERYIACAVSTQESEGKGVLVYEDLRKVLFLITEEAIAMLRYLMQEGCMSDQHTH